MASISSFVVAFDGRPVSGAEISRNGRKIASSDKEGRFEIPAKGLGKRSAFTFRAGGFMDNTVVLDEKSRALAPVVLAKIGKNFSFESAKGANLKYGASSLRIPPGAFADEKGKPYSGKVSLDFSLLDTSDPLQLAAAMGDFSGRMLDGKEVKLRSFGIMQIDAYTEKGSKLELLPGRGISASIKVPKKLVEFAPPRTGLFSFDTADGFWVQTGWVELNRTTLTYNGTITDLGGLNIDDPTLLSCITIKLLTVGVGLPGAGFEVTATGPGAISKGTTDSSGSVCLLVLKGSTVTITAWGSIGGAPYITPPIQIQVTAPTQQASSADCGDPVACPSHTVPIISDFGFIRTSQLKSNQVIKLSL